MEIKKFRRMSMNKKFIRKVQVAIIGASLALLCACANQTNQSAANERALEQSRKAQQDAAKALRAAEEAKAAAEAAKTEKERVDRMFEQTMKK